jgi:hypothetical protein
MQTPDVEQCGRCGEFSAYCWDDCNAYGDFADGIVPGGFVPAPGTIAHIGCSSSWEWECGHCGTRWVERNSPINAECYTHVDPDTEDDE